MKRSQLKVDHFLRGYLDCALFTTDENPPSGMDYVESGRADCMYARLPEDFIEQAKADCLKFQQDNARLLEQAGDSEQNGNDFWHSRNGHGVGFWDRGYPDEIGDGLHEAAKEFGEVWLGLEPEALAP
jgi:hypothetical protein